MSDIDIQRLRFDQKEVGKTFSSSKILYTWEFILNKKSHKIEFYDSRLSDKKKITLDGSVLYYDKDDSEFFSYKFSLSGSKFELCKINEDRYDIKINGKRFKQLMSDERNGKLDKAREERQQRENEQKEIDEYNRRAMEYNGSNYYEGMEYKIMEKEREKERERERQRQRQREMEEREGDDDVDDLFDDNQINQIKNNIQHTMNKSGGNNFNGNNQDQFFNNPNNNNNNNNSNNFDNFFNFANNGNRNNNINQGLNEVFDFTNNRNNNQYNNQYNNNNGMNFNNNDYNNNNNNNNFNNNNNYNNNNN